MQSLSNFCHRIKPRGRFTSHKGLEEPLGEHGRRLEQTTAGNQKVGARLIALLEEGKHALEAKVERMRKYGSERAIRGAF